MSFKWIGSAFVCSALAFACGGGGGGGGGSGVDQNKLIVDVSSAEATDMCEFIVSNAPAFHDVTCSDGTMGTAGFETPADEDAAVADCVDTFTGAATQVPNCTATVGEVEDCFVALFTQTDAELCTGDDPPECAALFNDPDCN